MGYSWMKIEQENLLRQLADGEISLDEYKVEIEEVYKYYGVDSEHLSDDHDKQLEGDQSDVVIH